MKWRYPVLIFGGFCCSSWGFIYRPFPMPGEEPLLDLLLYHTPNFYIWVVRWYYVAPAVAVVVGGLIINTVYHVWFEKVEDHLPSYKVLPDWPLSPKKDAGPGIVVGEVHHPVKAVEIPNPKWLVIPERGLYTGVAIFGAVGSGKTSACMHPFAQQILSWQAKESRSSERLALVLEVKGDFCHDIRKILADAGREDDYIELGMDGRWQWNPLSTKVLDSYSPAYTVSSLAQSIIRQGQGAVLATGLHQSGPLDYRTLPGLSRPVGHTSAGLSLRHRQGTVRGQNQGSRGVCPAAERGNDCAGWQILLTEHVRTERLEMARKRRRSNLSHSPQSCA